MSDAMSIAALLVMLTTAIASLGTLLILFERHIGGTPLLVYDPRQRVPWQSGIVLLAMLLTFSGVIFTFFGRGSDPQALTENELPQPSDANEADEGLEQFPAPVSAESEKEANSAKDFILNSLGTTLFLILMVVVLGIWLHISVGASRIDLGLPTSGAQTIRDIRIGSIACAASLLPIYVLQIGLTVVLQPEVEHPIVEQLSKNHSPAMLLAGILLVVVAAPLGEEFLFRLLLQGWLERWEDATIGYAGSDRRFAVETAHLPDYALTEVEQESVTPIEEEILIFPGEPPPMPSKGVLTALPHGWLPILISGTLFGLAHLGHGVSPVPLVLFGIVLGYLYQRTHRLIPSITAHALFNAYSMTMLWLQLED